ncbi:Hpt domain-containing protein [Tabrizicola sp.]|uniref:Hpt domain-containing protein n=1 Tax=Tabrizicola sp. TaxID=2005166 RepID=UPI003F319259
MTLPDHSVAITRADALQDLRRAAHALSRHLDTGPERADLALIEEAISRLSANPKALPDDIGEFDRSRLDHLLDLTGPDLGPELLARLTEDLTATLDSLQQGAAVRDWKRLREATHVLISLAGSVGALSLQAMAEGLNTIAHSQDQAAAQATMPMLMRQLRALISFVSSTRMPNGAST